MLSESERIDFDGASDVLNLLLAPVLEREGELALEFVVDLGRDRDPARIGDALQTHGYVHAIAVEIAIGVGHYVPKVHANAQQHAPVLWLCSGAISEHFLHLDRAGHGGRGAGKL